MNPLNEIIDLLTEIRDSLINIEEKMDDANDKLDDMRGRGIYSLEDIYKKLGEIK